MSAQRCAPDRSAKAVSVRSEPTLAPEASAALRDQLAAELRAIGSADDVAKWAYRALNVKNTLTAADAARVEQIFEKRLASIAAGAADVPHISHERRPTHRRKARRKSAVVDLDWTRVAGDASDSRPGACQVGRQAIVSGLRSAPCRPIICNLRSHARLAARSATSSLSRFVGDITAKFIIVVMNPAWWNKVGIDPTVVARTLWLETHPVPAISGKGRVKNPTSAVINSFDLRNAKRERQPPNQGSNCETKPIEKAVTRQ